MKLKLHPTRALPSAAQLKKEADVLLFALRSKKTPWYVKAGMGLLIAYLLSPVDILPDTIPLAGYLDDLVLIPLGLKGLKSIIPQSTYDEYERHLQREQAKRRLPYLLLTIVIVIVSMAVVAWTRP